MSEARESELTKMDSITDNLEVTENENVDEAITIGLLKEKISEAYKETISTDIENIDTFDTRTKVNTKK